MKDKSITKRVIKYEGKLELAGFKVPCYVLEDGTRVLSGRGMQETLKMVDEIDEGKQTSGGQVKALFEPKIARTLYLQGEKGGPL